MAAQALHAVIAARLAHWAPWREWLDRGVHPTVFSETSPQNLVAHLA